MFYLRTSSLNHKTMQDNFGNARIRNDWESSRFRIPRHKRILMMEVRCTVYRFQVKTSTNYFHL